MCSLKRAGATEREALFRPRAAEWLQARRGSAFRLQHLAAALFGCSPSHEKKPVITSFLLEPAVGLEPTTC
jgi:hypothetical protein